MNRPLESGFDLSVAATALEAWFVGAVLRLGRTTPPLPWVGMQAGWWVKLEGEDRDLRELASHFKDVGSRMFADGRTTKAAVERFTRTANSRGAIGGEARHGHDRFQPPKNPLSHKEAHDLILGLVRHWLAEKAPPQPAREVVIEVRPEPEQGATISDEIA